jgi:hypothetical protein
LVRLILVLQSLTLVLTVVLTLVLTVVHHLLLLVLGLLMEPVQGWVVMVVWL